MLTIGQVIKHLPLSDFARLCHAIDKEFGNNTRFDINYIELVEGKRVAQIDAGEGRVMKVKIDA